MNKLTVLLGVLLCLAVVNARHYSDRAESERLTDDDEPSRKEADHTSQTRHRRRRWQSNGGYDYQARYDYRNDRRDYYNSQQDIIPQIYRLLEEISAFIRRPQPPPPPPQPIYIPYPVPYFIPKVVVCKTPQVTKSPNVTSRFPEMEDTNQNWGFVTSNENADYDEENDGSRPISFVPIKPKQFMKRPAPSVEHGSLQANIPLTTRAPFAAQARVPNMCHAAVLSCCSSSDTASQQKCFIDIGCDANLNSGVMCSPQAVSEALENFKKAYAPVN